MSRSAPRETTYTWDIASDRLDWQPDAAAVLGATRLAGLAATDLAARIAPEHLARWRSAVLDAPPAAAAPHGVPYRVRFALMAEGPPAGDAVWLEDSGRWWPGADGRPARARGVLRRIDADYLEAQHLLGHIPGDETRDGLNRTRLVEAAGALLGRARRTGRPAALLMVSVAGLDAVNTRLGPDVGDELIAAVGRVMKAGLGGSDGIVRYASNTFAVLLDGCGADALAGAASRLIAEIDDATLETSAGPLKAAIAVGGIALPAHAATAADAISGARAALEAAKRAPRPTFVAHRPETAAGPRAKSVTGEVLAALEEDRLLLALQPIVEAATGRTVLYEGLLRLRRRDGTLLPAADFIEEAEQLGLARRIDRRALERALALLAAHPRLRLSLNVSSLTAGDPAWVKTLRTNAARDPDLARRLTIEITETAMIHDIEEVRAFVELLRAEGCRIAIDDFGTGYTSFRHLRTLPVDVLKIDGSFVRDLPHDRQGCALVRTMIEMAGALGLETVAEWVSDAEAADFLAAAGATYLQGFLYGPPTPAEELIRKELL